MNMNTALRSGEKTINEPLNVTHERIQKCVASFDNLADRLRSIVGRFRGRMYGEGDEGQLRAADTNSGGLTSDISRLESIIGRLGTEIDRLEGAVGS